MLVDLSQRGVGETICRREKLGAAGTQPRKDYLRAVISCIEKAALAGAIGAV